MKKLLLVIILVLAVCGIAKAETAVDTDVANQLIQSQEGGQQNLIINYPEKQDVTYRSYIQLPNTCAELPIPPQPIYIDYKWQTWLEKTVFKNEELYSEEEIKQFLSENKDIIQFSGKLIGERIAPEVRLLNGIPKDGIKMFSVELEGPANGALDESVLRANSIAHIIYKANRIHIRVRLKLNPKNAGNAVGAKAGASMLEGTMAMAFAAGPQVGESESRVYDIYQIKVDGYNDGPIISAKAPIQETKKENKLNIVFFNKNGLDDGAIGKNINWLEENWDTILKKRGKIEFLAITPPECEEAEKAARETMIKVGSGLREKGYDEKTLESIFRYKAKAATGEQIEYLKNKGFDGVVLINIIPG
jgi:hypothetical protein